MKHLSEAKEALVELMFKGLDHGVSSIEDEEGLLVAFTIFEENKELKIVRFVTEKAQDGEIEAKAHLTKMEQKPELAIIAYDGIVTIENQEFDSIIIEAFDENDSTGYVLAQRFIRKTADTKFEPIGNAAFLGNCDNILK